MINRDRLKDEFVQLVKIDSPSFCERQMADYLIPRLQELGFEVKEDEAWQHYQGTCGNIYGYLPGKLELEPILFSCHLDTVEPGRGKKAIIHEDGTITSDGTTILGADDLSGIVAILEAIRVIKEKGMNHRPIEILFSIAEEAYIKGAAVFDYDQIHSNIAYVLDLTGNIGLAALAAPSFISYKAHVLGKAVHAGFSPELGINAIQIVAESISNIKQGRIDEETTVNIGLIEGGTATNIVSDHCLIQGEIRSIQHEKATEILQEIQEIFRTTTRNHGGSLEFSSEVICVGYRVSESHKVVKRYKCACDNTHLSMELIDTMGGSDNNVFFSKGITGIVIACGMNDVHSVNEYSSLNDLEKCSELVYHLITMDDEIL